MVLPSDRGEPGWSVFLLPSTTRAKLIPFGGAHRVEVSGDATTITQSRKYADRCIAFDRGPKPRQTAESLLFVSHLLDPAPTALHVWLSLMIGKAVVVMTSTDRSIWMVDKARIRLLEKGHGNGGSTPGTDETAPARLAAATGD